jgi:hypothetical protein
MVEFPSFFQGGAGVVAGYQEKASCSDLFTYFFLCLAFSVHKLHQSLACPPTGQSQMIQNIED